MAALAGASALAADLPVRRPVPEPIVMPSAPAWTGFYFGGGVDARFNAVDANVTEAFVGTPPRAIPLPTTSPGYTNPLMWWGAGPGAMQYIDNISIGLRLYGGYNWQVAPRWVVGVEVDYAYANEIAVFHGSPYPANLIFGLPNQNGIPFGATYDDEFKVTTGWDASVRLRGGWLYSPTTLIYLTAGLAWAHLEVTSTCSTVPTPNVNNCAPGNYFGGTLGPNTISHSAVKMGWTVGAGVESMLTSNWMVRGQYRFSDFGYPSFGPFKPFSFSGTRTCTGCADPGASPLSVSYELPWMQHHFEVGVAYKF
ncbi:MAG: outer membrane protein [Xanthobacteraceae bacterium]